MAINLKVNGAWKSVLGAYVKIGGVWKAASTMYVKVGGVWKTSSILSLTLDSFNRSVSPLGTSDTGTAWVANRGTWFANGTKAQTNTAASSYPLSSVPVGSANTSTSLDVTPGTGPSFWVSDANNWWAVVLYAIITQNTNNVYTCTDCNAGSYCNTCNNISGVVNIYYSTLPGDTGVLVSTNGGTFTGTDHDSLTCAVSYPTYTFPAGTNVYQITNGSATCGTITSGGTYPNCICGSTTSYTSGGTYPNCSCGVTTTAGSTYSQNNYYLRVIKCVSGTVTAISASDVSLGTSAPTTITVSTSGSTITASAKTGSTTLGTLTYTPSSPTTGTSTGIVNSPVDSTAVSLQGSTVDNFSSSSI